MSYESYDVVISFPLLWVLFNIFVFVHWFIFRRNQFLTRDIGTLSSIKVGQISSHSTNKVLIAGAPFALRHNLRLPGGGQDPGPVHSLEESSNAANQNQVQRGPRNGGLASGYC